MLNTTSPTPELRPLPPFLPPIPDSALQLALPIIVYWTLSIFFHLLDTYDCLPQYRLHTPAEVLKRNHVTRGEVIRDVLIQQVVQTIVGGTMALWEGVDVTGYEEVEVLKLYVALGGGTGEDMRFKIAEFVYWYMFPAARMGVAIFILDTWQYFLHRLMHEVKWLYRTFHSRHHRLYVPYAFGALYNHPFEGLLMDTIGASLAYKLSGLGTRGGMVFFSFSTMKTVDDHCGYSLPLDPLQKLFWNNASYHDVHHQSWGIKTNYSQPFLICWDRWLGTQWTGGDVTARYKASAEKAAAALERDAEPLPSVPAGKTSEQAEDGSKQVGEQVVVEGTEEVKRTVAGRRGAKTRAR